MPTVVLTNNGDNYFTSDLAVRTIYGLDGDDQITKSGVGDGPASGVDFIDAGAGNDAIRSFLQVGSFSVYGGLGNDKLTGEGFGHHFLYGGDGDDTLYASSAPVIGYPVANVASGGEGNDLIFGGGTLNGDGGDDRIYGGGIISGGDGNDFLVAIGDGGSGSSVYGGRGDDSLYGGSDGDKLVGGEGVDLLVGNGGDDYLYLGTGGGSGYGGDGADVGVGSQVNDVFVLGAGNDTAYGYAGNDYFYGEAGNDTLYGGDGVDVLIGGAGGDFLDGGEGVNYYFGGNGTGLGPDIFVARDIPSVQVIQDWTPGQGKVQLEGAGFTTLSGVLSHGYQNGAYYVIQIDGDTAVWLNGATATSLTAADFLFVS